MSVKRPAAPMAACSPRPATPLSAEAAGSDHEYLRRFVDPVLMPLIESLLLYQPESIYQFIHDYVDTKCSTRRTSIKKTASAPHIGYAKKLTSRRAMVEFMSTSVIPVMDDLAHQILRERPNCVHQFIQDVMAARLLVGGVSSADGNQYEHVHFQLHDTVLARYKGRPRYLRGVIIAVHPENESFTIQYEDGKSEHNVHRMCLKPAPAGDNNNNEGDHSNSDAKLHTSGNQASSPAPQSVPGRPVNFVVLIIGIDGSGKTTLLSTLQGDLEKEHVPSAGFTSVSFQTETGCATFYDLGGGPAFRDVWKEYYADAHAVMFVVDSADENLVLQSAVVLQDTMAHDMMKQKPLLIFANKRDQPTAVVENDLIELLQLKQYPNAKLMACVAKPAANAGLVDDHLEQGLHWLFDHVEKNYDALHDRVSEDTAAKKCQNEQRRAEQRARVSGWKEEREREQMATHDKPSFSSEAADSFKQTTQQEPEENVIGCCNCTYRPAVTKCAASKWMPVCAECATALKAKA